MDKIISYNDEHYIALSNDVIKGKQYTTLQQARFIRLMVSQIVKQDQELKKYVCRIQDFAEFFGISPQNLYVEVDKLTTDLLKAQVHIGTGNPKQPWEKINWFNCAKYDGQGSITLCLSEQIRPYVLELNKWYTQYQLKYVKKINSFYGIRLYEILKCDDNKSRETKDNFTYSIEKLREMLGCEKTNKKISDLKRKVVEKAVEEINKNTDYLVEVEYIKTGRKITHVKFYLYWNRENDPNPKVDMLPSKWCESDKI